MSTGPKATVVRPGEGRTFSFGPRRPRVLVDPQQPDSGLAVFESVIAPDEPIPPMHRHRSYDEAFYVLAGEMEFQVDGETERVGPGAMISIPRGVAHTFSNPGSEPARMLILLAPAQALELIEQNGVLVAGGPPDPAALRALYARHDSEIVPPN